MTLLLDTQIAVWWLAGSRQLGGPARKLLAESACVLSAAGVWEVAIKYRLGKLSRWLCVAWRCTGAARVRKSAFSSHKDQ